MTPSFDLFDLGSTRRAYVSTADLERACFLASVTGVAPENFMEIGSQAGRGYDGNDLFGAQLGTT